MNKVRFFPMQDDPHHKHQEHAPPLPWPVAEAVWKHLYAALGHGDQSCERIAERGGFSYKEIEIMAKEVHERVKAGRYLHVEAPNER